MSPRTTRKTLFAVFIGVISFLLLITAAQAAPNWQPITKNSDSGSIYEIDVESLAIKTNGEVSLLFVKARAITVQHEISLKSFGVLVEECSAGTGHLHIRDTATATTISVKYSLTDMTTVADKISDTLCGIYFEALKRIDEKHKGRGTST